MHRSVYFWHRAAGRKGTGPDRSPLLLGLEEDRIGQVRYPEAVREVDTVTEAFDGLTRKLLEVKTSFEAALEQAKKAEQEIYEAGTALRTTLERGQMPGPNGNTDKVPDLLEDVKDSNIIQSEKERQTLDKVGRLIKDALDQLPADQGEYIEITVGGHTDSLQVSLPDPKAQYLYNWNLSSLRATSVLYEFARLGLECPPIFVPGSMLVQTPVQG